MLKQKGIYAVLKNNLCLLEGLEFTPPSSARTKGDDTRYYVYTYLVRIPTFCFDFPFDEMYRRLLFFTLTRYVCTTLAVVLLIVQLYRYLFIR